YLELLNQQRVRANSDKNADGMIVVGHHFDDDPLEPPSYMCFPGVETHFEHLDLTSSNAALPPRIKLRVIGAGVGRHRSAEEVLHRAASSIQKAAADWLKRRKAREQEAVQKIQWVFRKYRGTLRQGDVTALKVLHCEAPTPLPLSVEKSEDRLSGQSSLSSILSFQGMPFKPKAVERPARIAPFRTGRSRQNETPIASKSMELPTKNSPSSHLARTPSPYLPGAASVTPEVADSCRFPRLEREPSLSAPHGRGLQRSPSRDPSSSGTPPIPPLYTPWYRRPASSSLMHGELEQSLHVEQLRRKASTVSTCKQRSRRASRSVGASPCRFGNADDTDDYQRGAPHRLPILSKGALGAGKPRKRACDGVRRRKCRDEPGMDVPSQVPSHQLLPVIGKFMDSDISPWPSSPDMKWSGEESLRHSRGAAGINNQHVSSVNWLPPPSRAAGSARKGQVKYGSAMVPSAERSMEQHSPGSRSCIVFAGGGGVFFFFVALTSFYVFMYVCFALLFGVRAALSGFVQRFGSGLKR
ncbi:hypothetical protein CYMTET_15962, partial [Cymbomonas tetramitiformis]